MARIVRAVTRDGCSCEPDRPRRSQWVVYTLSPLGVSLREVVSTLLVWAETNGRGLSRARAEYDPRTRSDRPHEPPDLFRGCPARPTSSLRMERRHARGMG